MSVLVVYYFDREKPEGGYFRVQSSTIIIKVLQEFASVSNLPELIEGF